MQRQRAHGTQGTQADAAAQPSATPAGIIADQIYDQTKICLDCFTTLNAASDETLRIVPRLTRVGPTAAGCLWLSGDHQKVYSSVRDC